MVYCGKPSKGCRACRDRKTRCDRLEPSCSQCIRAHRTCPGYRSQLDLMFRNESEAVMSKAKAQAKSKKKGRVTSPATSSSSSGESSPDTSPPAAEKDMGIIVRDDLANQTGPMVQTMVPSFGLAPSVQDRALGYFNAVSPSWLRNFDLVDMLCPQASNVDEYLVAGMSAVGLAGLSDSVRAPELMIRARRDYVHALRLTNAALRSPTHVKKDSTLFSVMILSVFEMLTGSSEKSLAAWTEHINGAATLVKLRGPEQFKTAAGKQMFLQVISNLMVSCVQRTIPMPASIIKLRKEAEKWMDTSSPAWVLSGTIIDFTIFRGAVRDCKIVGPRAVIEKALRVDHRFISTFADLPPSWRYETAYSDENPHLIWNGSYHVYKEHWIGNIWNGMRTCRIMLHEMIRDQLLAASSAITPIFTDDEAYSQLRSSLDIMVQMQKDILASVPSHSSANKTVTKGTMIVEGSRSYFVIWPLYIVGAMDLATDDVRDWVIARLRTIGDTGGIRQALVVADHLAHRQNIQAWETKPAPRRSSTIMSKWEAFSEMPGAPFAGNVLVV